MEKTVINIKTDKKLKQEVQEVARELGLPLGTIINAYLRELAREKRVVFSIPPTPNKQLQALLKKVRSEKQNRKDSTKPLSYQEAIEHLDSL
jgi:addiction module RelB/DinJ family antitoxin